MTVKSFFRLVLGAIFVLLFALAIVSVLLVMNQRNSLLNQSIRQKSYLLVDQMRQTGDDLTRLARTFVVTGDAKFEQHYREALAIRNGEKQLPAKYLGRVYWEFVVAGEIPSDSESNLTFIPFQSMASKLGFSSNELEKIREAETALDQLILIELAAIEAVHGHRDSNDKKIAPRAQTSQAAALQSLYSTEYYQHRAKMLKPIDELLGLLESRTETILEHDVHWGRFYLLVILGLVIALFGLFLFSGRMIFQRVCSPIVALQRQTRLVGDDLRHLAEVTVNLARGNFDASFVGQALPHRTHSKDEIGELSRTHDEMIDHLQAAGVAISGITSDLSKRAVLLCRLNEELTSVNAGLQSEIAARHEAESRVSQLNASLELRVNERTADLFAAKIEIERAIRLQRTILDHAVYSIIATDCDGIITVFNPAAERMLGYSSEEIVGKQTPAIIHLEAEIVQQAEELSREFGEYIEPGFDVFTRKSKANLPNEHKWTYVRKDGSQFPVLLGIAALRNDSGEITGYLGIANDITERVATEAALQFNRDRFELAARGAVDGIWDWNVVTGEDYFSSRFCELLGFTKAELLPRVEVWESLLHPDDRDRTHDKLKAHFEQRLPYDVEFRLRTKSGAYRWFRASGQAKWDADGKPVRMAGSLTDITPRKAAEAELIAAHAAATEANRAKSEFLANMSHEIRTPMNGIVGMTQLALDTELTAIQREYLETVNFSADALLRIINDILDFSKIEAGKLEFEKQPFSLRESLDDAMKSIAFRAEEKHLRLIWETQAEIPDRLIGDIGRLRQVLVNLVGNAIKFTEVGEVRVTVVLQKLAATKAQLKFSVIDSGIGIPRQKQDLIFEAFSQADASTTRVYGGTGLGLSISRQIVKLMNGDISIESEAGHGSTFSFEIEFPISTDSEDFACSPKHVPIVATCEIERAAETVISTSPKSEVGQLRPLQILLAEDNLVNQRLAVQILSKQGHSVHIVANGQLALDALETMTFDVVLMDIQMPILDGLQAVSILREREKSLGGHIPVIAITAHAMNGDRERCLALGMDDYVSKPIIPGELSAALKRAVSNQHMTLGCEEADGEIAGRVTANDDTSTALLPPSYDLARALERFDGDTEFLKELAQIFLECVPQTLMNLDLAVANRNLKEIGGEAHTIKGTLGNFCAHSAYDMALQLEVLCRDGTLDDIEETYQNLVRELDRLSQALRMELVGTTDR